MVYLRLYIIAIYIIFLRSYPGWWCFTSFIVIRISLTRLVLIHPSPCVKKPCTQLNIMNDYRWSYHKEVVFKGRIAGRVFNKSVKGSSITFSVLSDVAFLTQTQFNTFMAATWPGTTKTICTLPPQTKVRRGHNGHVWLPKQNPHLTCRWQHIRKNKLHLGRPAH